jgi:hypothetical protein
MSPLRLPRFKRTIIVCICLGLLLGVAAWAAGHRQSATTQRLSVHTRSRTSVVAITKLAEDADSVRVQITNQSDKVVLAYTLSLGNDNNVTSFGLSLLPGNSRTELVQWANIKPTREDKATGYIIVSAAYLSDGTTAGETKYTTRLQNRMLGIQEQAERSLAALRASSAANESNSDRLLSKLQGDFTLSVLVDEASLPSERLAGRAVVKETVSRALHELNGKKGVSVKEIKQSIDSLTADLEEVSGIRHLTKGKGGQK